MGASGQTFTTSLRRPWWLVAVVLGCEPVGLHFGEVPLEVVANVYVERLEPGSLTTELGAFCRAPSAFSSGTNLGTTNTSAGGVALAAAEYAGADAQLEPATEDQIVWSTSDGSLVVRLIQDLRVLEEHVFDRPFLESGRATRIELALRNGEQYGFTVWGSAFCEQCPPHAPGGGETCFPETHIQDDSSDTPAVLFEVDD